MGNVFGVSFSSSANKLPESTIQAIHCLSQADSSTKNSTESISRMLHSAGPIDVKVNLDMSPNLQELIEKFIVLFPLVILILFLILIAIWHITSCCVGSRGRVSNNKNNDVCFNSKV